MTTLGQDNRTESFSALARELIGFSLPLILSGILQQLYNWADAFIVGNVEGEVALAAIGGTTTVVSFYLMAINGFTLGLAILFAQKYGAGKSEELPRLLSTFAIGLCAVFSLLTVAGVLLAPAFLRLLHTTADTFALAADYLRIVLLGVPFLSVYNVYSAALRGMGNSKAPFYAVMISSLVNVGLDIVFVAGLGWSVTGAAIATVISQAAMTVFIILYSSRRYAGLRFRLGREAFDRQMLAEGCHFGFPPMIQSSITSAGNLVLQNFMNGFGTQTVAAITTAYRVDTIVILPMINLGSGISTLVAQSKGEGQERRALKILGVGLVIMAVISLALTALVIPMGAYLIAMFGAGAEAVAIGEAFFVRFASFYIVFGLAAAIRGYVEGSGDVVYSSFAGITTLVCRIVLSYALVGIFDNMVIAFAEGFSWILLLLLYVCRFLQKRRR